MQWLWIYLLNTVGGLLCLRKWPKTNDTIPHRETPLHSMWMAVKIANLVFSSDWRVCLCMNWSSLLILMLELDSLHSVLILDINHSLGCTPKTLISSSSSLLFYKSTPLIAVGKETTRIYLQRDYITKPTKLQTSSVEKYSKPYNSHSNLAQKFPLTDRTLKLISVCSVETERFDRFSVAQSRSWVSRMIQIERSCVDAPK